MVPRNGRWSAPVDELAPISTVDWSSNKPLWSPAVLQHSTGQGVTPVRTFQFARRRHSTALTWNSLTWHSRVINIGSEIVAVKLSTHCIRWKQVDRVVWRRPHRIRGGESGHQSYVPSAPWVSPQTGHRPVQPFLQGALALRTETEWLTGTPCCGIIGRNSPPLMHSMLLLPRHFVWHWNLLGLLVFTLHVTRNRHRRDLQNGVHIHDHRFGSDASRQSLFFLV